MNSNEKDSSILKPKVTVIIPVYNVEDCLERCLNSLCRQTMPDIELVMVDDASTDRCGEICETYAAKDNRFKVFHHTENRGLSAARNLGIKHASGEYLMFVDSDDWVHPDFCKNAYECATKYKVEIVMFNYKKIGDESVPESKFLQHFKSFSSGIQKSQKAMDMILADGGNAAWNKIYKRNLFDDISYPEGFLYEDTGATYRLVHKASGFYYLDKVLYYQYIRPGSITTSKVTNKTLNDRAKLNSQRYRDLIVWGYYSEQLEYRFKDFALWYLKRKKKDNSDTDYLYISKAFRSTDIRRVDFSNMKKLQLFIYKYCPLLFDIYYSMRGMKI